jgi:hypothetical protein
MLIAVAACAGGGDDGTLDSGPPDTGAKPCLDPTFSSMYFERFAVLEHCADTQCHYSGTAAGELEFGSGKSLAYTAILADTASDVGAMTQPKRVVPGDPGASFLYVKLAEANPPGGRMPLGQTPLQECDLDAIRTWILGGAPND